MSVEKYKELIGYDCPELAIAYVDDIVARVEAGDVGGIVRNHYQPAAQQLGLQRSQIEMRNEIIGLLTKDKITNESQIIALHSKLKNPPVLQKWSESVIPGDGKVTSFLSKRSVNETKKNIVLWSSTKSSTCIINGKNFGRINSLNSAYQHSVITYENFTGEIRLQFVDSEGRHLKFENSVNYERPGVDEHGQAFGPFTPWKLEDDGYTAVIYDGAVRAEMK